MNLSVSASGRANSARSETDAALKNEHGFHRQLGAAAVFEVRPASRIPAARTSLGQASQRNKGRSVMPAGDPLEYTGHRRCRGIQPPGYLQSSTLEILHQHDRRSHFRAEIFAVRSQGSTLL